MRILAKFFLYWSIIRTELSIRLWMHWGGLQYWGLNVTIHQDITKKNNHILFTAYTESSHIGMLWLFARWFHCPLVVCFMMYICKFQRCAISYPHELLLSSPLPLKLCTWYTQFTTRHCTTLSDQVGLSLQDKTGRQHQLAHHCYMQQVAVPSTLIVYLFDST